MSFTCYLHHWVHAQDECPRCLQAAKETLEICNEYYRAERTIKLGPEVNPPHWVERIRSLEAHLTHARECMQAVVEHVEAIKDGEGYDPLCAPSCHCPICQCRHCLAVTAEVSRVGGGTEDDEEKK